MLLAVTLWSAYLVMLKRKPQGLSPIVLLDGAVLCNVLMMAPFYVRAELAGAGFHFTPPQRAALLYVSLFGVEFFHVSFWGVAKCKKRPQVSSLLAHTVP